MDFTKALLALNSVANSRIDSIDAKSNIMTFKNQC